MNEHEFWMVWIEDRSGPTKKHYAVDEARLQAERLLRLPENRGRIAYILESQSFGAIESPVSWRTVVERG